MIKKILVPMDGSVHSENAYDYALDLAKRFSAKITVLSVVPVVLSGLFPKSATNYIKELEKAREKVLLRAAQKAKKINVETTKRLANGRPAEVIIETAKKGNFDLIVMASRGTGGIREFLLGSVSHRVADEAQCPILIVK